jgi:hypothetical protein
VPHGLASALKALASIGSGERSLARSATPGEPKCFKVRRAVHTQCGASSAQCLVEPELTAE